MKKLIVYLREENKYGMPRITGIFNTFWAILIAILLLLGLLL